MIFLRRCIKMFDIVVEYKMISNALCYEWFLIIYGL